MLFIVHPGETEPICSKCQNVLCEILADARLLKHAMILQLDRFIRKDFMYLVYVFRMHTESNP